MLEEEEEEEEKSRSSGLGARNRQFCSGGGAGSRAHFIITRRRATEALQPPALIHLPVVCTAVTGGRTLVTAAPISPGRLRGARL